MGRAGRWPEKLQPPPSGSGAVTAPPSHRPRAQRGGGGLGRGSEGLDPPQDAEGHADQTTQPLPRGGPSPHWLEVDKDWKTCKMATGSQAGHESRSGAPVRPTPTQGAAPAQPSPSPPPPPRCPERQRGLLFPTTSSKPMGAGGGGCDKRSWDQSSFIIKVETGSSGQGVQGAGLCRRAPRGPRGCPAGRCPRCAAEGRREKGRPPTSWTSEFYTLLEMDATSPGQHRAPRKRNKRWGGWPRGVPGPPRKPSRLRAATPQAAASEQTRAAPLCPHPAGAGPGQARVLGQKCSLPSGHTRDHVRPFQSK